MKPIKELSGECLDAVPRDIDWTNRGDDEWASYSCEACDECVARIPLTEGHGGEKHSDLEDTPCDGHVPLFDGPMMNYWYPLGSQHSVDDAQHIYGPLCLVRVGEEWGLALTGGGMDLSWEIVENYVRLGYLPPIHFSDLPQMCGRGTSAKDRKLLAACRASVIVGIRRLRGKLRSLSATKKWSEEYAAGKDGGGRKFVIHP